MKAPVQIEATRRERPAADRIHEIRRPSRDAELPHRYWPDKSVGDY